MNEYVEEDFEDDCVIFEGSPLYETLMQTGSLAEELGIELGTKKVISEENHSNTTNRETDATSKVWRNSLFGAVCERCRLCYNKIKSYLVPDIQGVYVKYKTEMIKLLSDCSCIESDDLDYLQFYIHSQNGLNQHCSTIQIPYVLYEAIPCLLAISYTLWTSKSQTSQVWSISSVFPWILTAAAILKSSISEAWKYFHKRKCKNEVTELERFLKLNENFVGTVKKCLRLIQETELISRGFTLVSQRNPLSRLEGGQKIPRQCPVLRKLIFTDCRDGVLSFREFTKNLLEIHPLSSELDVYGSYLAFEPLQSYGPCLQIGPDNQDKLCDITDGFAVAALKGINHLFCLHQSEFIKSLVLVLQDNPSQGTELLQNNMKQLLSDISLQLIDWTVSLQKCYDFHSFDWMKKEPVKRGPTHNSDQDAILVAVHSLDLHLQAAITRVRAVSEMIEKSSGDNQLLWKPDEFLMKMQPIKAELESCKGCWEESLCRIEKAVGKCEEGSTSSDLMKPVPVDDAEEVDIRVKKVEDYIIEDQVFEAYTDSNEVLADYDWEKPLTAEEKEKKRREKEEALRMLTELKSVISVRAVETEKREKAAILKMHPELQTDKLTELKSGVLTEDNSDKNLSDQTHPTVNTGRVQLHDECTDVGKHADVSKLSAGHIDSYRNIDSCSYVSRQGVRRLRKSNMLDLSDSDSDDYPGSNVEDNGSIEEDVRQRLGLPLQNKAEHFSSDVADNNSDDENVSDEFVQFRLPALTLEERLEKLTGAKFDMTADIALKAAAKSREFGGMDEITFGGDVYGELSDDKESIDEDMDINETDVTFDKVNVYNEGTHKL